LNNDRPPVFCPGCAHEPVVRALDQTLVNLGLTGPQVALVSDIGCSGLFDTFFNTHAFHGLHGRALTYATGLKMARPELQVIVTMGDGGLGIGGAHVLSTCRRNLDLTLLVLNNFNYGMTGGQFSTTTPAEAQVNSGFLNRLEKPLDVCQVAGAAGAPYLVRTSAYRNNLVDELEKAISFIGFSVVDIHGLCPGRYAKQNKLNPDLIDQGLAHHPSLEHYLQANQRPEYGRAYRLEAARQPLEQAPLKIDATTAPPAMTGRREVVFLGSAGQRIVSAGEILCLAGLSAGLKASQKNDYPITVLRGHSISETILSDTEIDYTGLTGPSVVLALAPEGIARRMKMLRSLPPDTLILASRDTELPPLDNQIIKMDFQALHLKNTDRALAALTLMASRNLVLNMEMLEVALRLRFSGETLRATLELVARLRNQWS
jgi:Pyruvate/2-oxoacid:ferredoxin oxidoreductase gamma subunit